MKPNSDDSVYCRVCHRALNIRLSATGTVSYHHATDLQGDVSGHRPDPVPGTELADPVLVCDICNRPDPAWTYLCADQFTESQLVTTRVVGLGDYHRRHGAARTLRAETTPGITQAWGTRWAVCSPCAALIEAKDLYGLVRRATETLPPNLTRGKQLPQVRGRLHATFSTVLHTRAPGRGRITPNNPLGIWSPADNADTPLR